MSSEEMSNQFDLMTNVFKTNYGFGQEDKIAFDEYEKSVFLTMAQEAFVIMCYDGRNNSGYQFEITEEDRRMLDSLVVTKEYPISEQLSQGSSCGTGGLTGESVFYKLPRNLMYITYEQVSFSDSDKCINGKYAAIYPVTQDEFWKTYKNPFRGPNSRRVLRLDAGDNIVELVSKNTIGKYTIRYVKRPNPIILEDLPDDLTIDGQSYQQDCTLDRQVHNKIVEIAVNMALRTKSIGK